MGRRTLALVALVVALVAVVGVTAAWRAHDYAPGKPRLKSSPAKQFGDDADLMRRLQRKNLVTTSR